MVRGPARRPFVVSESLEVARMRIAEETWQQGPRVVNAEIARIIYEYTASDEEETLHFATSYDAQRWLEGKPGEWALAIAVRSALRSMPALASEARTVAGDVKSAEEVILGAFRAVSAAWVAAINPDWSDNPELVAAINAAEAATFANKATTNAVISAYAAISSATTRENDARAVGAALAVSAAAGAAVAMAPANDRVEEGTIWDIAADDARILEHPSLPNDIAHHPLWPGGTWPSWWMHSWQQLRRELLLSNSDWEVWTRWFEDRLNGGPANNAAEIARVTIADEIWQQGPRAVNAEIASLLGEEKIHRERSESLAPAPEIPAQGYGPHFDIGDDGIITFASPAALDRQGNNVARLKNLHPSLRALSSDLTEALGRGNIPHWYLRERAEAYGAIVDQDLESVNISLLYVEGVRLANAERAALGEKELPPLAQPIREAIDTLLQVHGSFILATAEGMEAIAAEERYQRTAREEIEYRKAAVDFARSLQNEPRIIDPKVAAFVLGTAGEIGKGANPERSDTVATGLVKNAAITVSTAAALAALTAAAAAAGSPALLVGAGATVLIVGDGLRKSKPFAAVSALVSRGLDNAAEGEVSKALGNLSERLKPQLRFVLRIEPQLRRLAGQREEFNWVIRFLDWVRQQPSDGN